MLVLGRHDYRAVADSKREAALRHLRLCDGTAPFLGQDLRCIIGVRRKLRFGEVVRLYGERGNQVVVTRTGFCRSEPRSRRSGEELLLSTEELQQHFRPARLGTIREQANSHYAERPVVVVVNHIPGLRPNSSRPSRGR